VLREQIQQGAYGAGTGFPAERELCKLHGLGLMTVRRAMAILREEGLITTSRGSGSVVRVPIRRATVVLDADSCLIARMPSAVERHAMNLEPGVPLLEIRHVRGQVQVLAADQVEVTGRSTAAG